MKSVVGQVGCAPLFCFSRTSLDLSLGVAFVGAARRSLAPHSRSELGDRQWRRRGQRSLPLLVSLREADSRFGRPNDSTHTTIRGVDAFVLLASSHLSIRSGSRGCLAGHIRFGDVEFRVVRSCVVPHEASRTQCQVKVRWSQQWSWLACLFVRFSLVSLPVGCYLVFKSHWSHSFCRRPAGHAARSHRRRS